MFLKNNGKKKPKIFFIGIGGISMSALAKYLIINGFDVSGSDKTASDATKYLCELGCKIYIGHCADNILNQDIIIYNSAIQSDNVELNCALSLKKCILKRVELLQMISNSFYKSVGFSGTHGKTTSTAMFSHILLHSNLGFTSHIGGFDSYLGNLFQNGKDVFATEVCEFDRNIDNYTSSIGVVLNIDNDHLNSYKDISDIENSFKNYLKRCETPIINFDDNRMCELSKNYISFGLSKTADYYAKVIGKNKNYLNLRFYEFGKKLCDAKLKTLGQHNIYNALSAVSVARCLNISEKSIVDGLNGFIGVKRRNEFLGKINGASVFADYAHHPSEIKCSLSSYACLNKKLIVVFQPHTFSRTKLLFNDFIEVFSKCEHLFIYKTYPARETENDGYSAKKLADELNCKNYFDNKTKLFDNIKNIVDEQSIILILGAGDLYDTTKEYLKDYLKETSINKTKK